MEDKILACISKVLKEPVTVDTCRKNTPRWDSIRHLQIIATLEEELGLEIPIEKVAAIKTIADIFEIAREESHGTD